MSERRKRREVAILTALNKLGVANVEQLMKLNAGGLGNGGRRNALRVLSEMENDGFIDSKRVGVKLFCVKGRGFGQWEHKLLRNDFVIWKGIFDKCRYEAKLKRNDVVRIVADVGVWSEQEGWTFYEIDRLQKKKTNLEKLKVYNDLGALERLVVVCYKERAHHFPDVRKIYVEDFS